jgi:hypothetical protein
VVAVLQQPHQEVLLRLADDPPELLGEPDVEDGVIQPLAGGVVLQDIQAVVLLEVLQQAVDDLLHLP